jgi:hypothetical protein
MQRYHKSTPHATTPQDFSRRARLQSSTLRSREWEDHPSVYALAALNAHANVWLAAVRHGRPVAADRRPQ